MNELKKKEREWEVNGLRMPTLPPAAGRASALGTKSETLRDHEISQIRVIQFWFYFLCRMSTSYHGQFFTWPIQKLSLVWKSVVATREVNIKRKSLGFFCFPMYLCLKLNIVLVLRGTDFLRLWATPCRMHEYIVFELWALFALKIDV